MRLKFISLLFVVPLLSSAAPTPGTVPTFNRAVGGSSYTLVGHNPAEGRVTTIPTILVPITLSFEAKKSEGKPFVLDAAPDIPRVLGSPVFSNFHFPSGDDTQYADAMLRATFRGPRGYHTLLGSPQVKPLRVTVPTGSGYVLTSKSTGGALGVVDIEFLQRELFKQLPRQQGKLV